MDKSGRKRPKARLPAPAPGAPVLRGNALASVDDAGRLKLPAGFRRAIEDGYGKSLYLTSLSGDNLSLYPLAVWSRTETRLLGLPTRHPAVAKFVARTSYFGAEAEIDSQGRVLVPALLRPLAGMDGEVAVLGALDHLEAWNNALFRARLEADPLTGEDLRALGELGLWS